MSADSVHNEQSGEPSPPPGPLPVPPGPTWFQRLSAVLFAIFCFELGLFLVIYPWTREWTDNYLSVAVPDAIRTGWRLLWNNPYVRGGVSGLGLVNVWVAVAEVLQMFSGKRP